jgi:hypothetical protein
MSTWNAALLEQTTFLWEFVFIPRLSGMTDEEYRWAPVDGCWSVRPTDAGPWMQDGIGVPDPDPPPFTTIAWRIAHITTIFGERASNHFDDGSFDPSSLAWDGTASTATNLMSAEYHRWSDGVRSLGEDGLFRPCGPTEGPFADNPLRDLVLHISREFCSHSAEVSLLRDLYRDAVVSGTGLLRP